jgi:hypothetical protein
MVENNEQQIAADEQKPEEKVSTDLTGIEKEEVSKTKSTEINIMTVGGDEPRPGQNVVQATVTLVSPPTSGSHAPIDRVYVKIKYPQGWKKDRHFRDGDIKEVSKETAEQFIKAGYATMTEKPKDV